MVSCLDGGADFRLSHLSGAGLIGVKLGEGRAECTENKKGPPFGEPF